MVAKWEVVAAANPYPPGIISDKTNRKTNSPLVASSKNKELRAQFSVEVTPSDEKGKATSGAPL